MQYLFDDNLTVSFQKVVEKSLIEFFKEHDLTSFQKMLRDGMNSICAEIQKRLLERIDDHFVSNADHRKNWVIERRNDAKTILSPFGQITYRRTYFKNKKTGQYAHLADQVVGYSPHRRLDSLLEADIVTEVAELSYRKAGMSQERNVPGTGVSGQTVMNLVRKFKPEKILIKKQVKEKRKCRVIYIEADEDHVSHGEKGVPAFEQRLVYVHEGAVRVGKNRSRLVGKKYFTFPPGVGSEEIWGEIWRYLDATYDLEETEYIFVLGDGAGWIKSGAEYIPTARYVMDRFHLRQAIQRAAGADENKRAALTKAVWDAGWTDMNRLLISFLEEAEQESRRESIEKVIKYLNNNWQGIKAHNTYREVLVGCSAEGHVSHVLSARLSSRPMGWSYVGANQVAHLRVHHANGVDLHAAYLKGHYRTKAVSLDRSINPPTTLAKASGESYEVFDNVPTLRRGARLSLGYLLRRISNGNSDF